MCRRTTVEQLLKMEDWDSSAPGRQDRWLSPPTLPQPSGSAQTSRIEAQSTLDTRHSGMAGAPLAAVLAVDLVEAEVSGSRAMDSPSLTGD